MSNGTDSAVRTVIFDFGGVFTVSPLALARTTATEFGVEPDGLVELMLGNYGIESDHPWQRVERGELDMADALTWFRLESRRRFGTEIDPMTIMAPMLTEPPRRSMIDLVTDLRAGGATTGLLTNNARELRGQWSEMAPWSELFDHVIDSSEEGVRKPSAEAFKLALDRCGEADPSRALMVDDFVVNIDGARAVGMRGVIVGEDPDPAIAEIRELAMT